MDRAFGAEAEAFLSDGDVTGKAAVEIFGRGFGDPLSDTRAQRLADVDVLARHAKRHARPPLTVPASCVYRIFGRKPGFHFPENALINHTWDGRRRTEGRGRTTDPIRCQSPHSRRLLLAPALHRGRDAHRLPVLGDG